jgi:hypothetical protein
MRVGYHTEVNGGMIEIGFSKACMHESSSQLSIDTQCGTLRRTSESTQHRMAGSILTTIWRVIVRRYRNRLMF